jgi:hypothetical protein
LEIDLAHVEQQQQRSKYLAVKEAPHNFFLELTVPDEYRWRRN